MGPNDKVLGVVSSIEGDKVHVVRAYDGRMFTFAQSQVFGTSSNLNATLNSQKSSKQWRANFLKGIDPMIHPLSETHPFLALGIGEQIDELPREVNMYPSARVMSDKGSKDFTDSVRAKIGNVNTTQSQVELRDALEDEAKFYRDKGDFSVETEYPRKSEETSVGGGSGASVLMILAGAALIYSLA